VIVLHIAVNSVMLCLLSRSYVVLLHGLCQGVPTRLWAMVYRMFGEDNWAVYVIGKLLYLSI